MKTLTAVLFAGGESRRMGMDKATLEINGELLWSRQLRVLRELQAERILISARNRPAWCPSEMETVLDQPPSHGPLSGLAAVLAAIKTSHALVLATDMPLMEAAFLRRLWEECDENHGVVPADRNSYDPLCAIYPASAIGVVTASLAGENYSLHGIIDRLVKAFLMQVQFIQESDRPFLSNLNTPAELATLRSKMTL